MITTTPQPRRDQLWRVMLWAMIFGQMLGVLLVAFSCRDGECPIERIKRVMQRGGDLDDGAIASVEAIEVEHSTLQSGGLALYTAPPKTARFKIAPHTQTAHPPVSSLRILSPRRILLDAPKQSPPQQAGPRA